MDVIQVDGNIKVVAELPGIDKKDINLNLSGNTLTINVDAEEQKYYKELDLPAEVEPKTVKSTYRNGVLEVILPKVKDKKPKGEQIKVE